MHINYNLLYFLKVDITCILDFGIKVISIISFAILYVQSALHYAPLVYLGMNSKTNFRQISWTLKIAYNRKHVQVLFKLLIFILWASSSSMYFCSFVAFTQHFFWHLPKWLSPTKERKLQVNRVYLIFLIFHKHNRGRSQIMWLIFWDF